MTAKIPRNGFIDGERVVNGVRERFAHNPADFTVTQSEWNLSYNDNGATVLVQDLDGLVHHLGQQAYYDGNLQAAVGLLASKDVIRHAPMKLIAEIIANFDPPLHKPLLRKLNGAPAPGDGTARHGYGIPVFERCGYACAYCGLDMLASYEAWLQLSIDHVIPHQMIRRDYSKEWIEDLANLVTCCRSCNEFGNRFRFDDPAPASEPAFFDLRDRVFVQRRARLVLAHARESLIYASQKEHFENPGHDR
jgi:hypothetical protein